MVKNNEQLEESRLLELKNKAMILWHRGTEESKKKIFDLLYREPKLDFQMYKFMGKYFEESSEFEKSFKCFWKALSLQLDDDCLRGCLNTIDAQKNKKELLLELTNNLVELPSLELQLEIVYKLSAYELHMECYLYALKVYEIIEQQFKEKKRYFKQYVELTLILIDYELKKKNPTQARFQLRKLLYLKETIVLYSKPISYYAIILDLVPLILKREDYKEIYEKASQNYRLFFEFFNLFYKGKYSKKQLQLLTSLNESDPRLKGKSEAMVEMIQLFKRQAISSEKLDDLYRQFPHDFFIAKLYSIVCKPTESFWDTFLKNHADHEEAIRWYWKFHRKERRKSSSNENVRVVFLGGGEKIGGTSILISIANRHLLLDAGMFLHEENFLTKFNKLEQLGIQLTDLDGVVVSHAHLDHTGSLPYIFKHAPNVPIYMTDATSKLMKVLLTDVVRRNPKGPYQQVDVEGVFVYANRESFNKTFPIAAGDDMWNVTFYEAGHILGAASMYIEFQGISILFTGDFSVENQLTCSNFSVPDHLDVDILITESTYGYLPSNTNISRQIQEKALEKTLIQTMERNGTMIIPAFAVGRSQEIISSLKNSYRDREFLPFNIVIDGKVGEICQIYEHEMGNLGIMDDVMVASDLYGREGNLSFREFLDYYVTQKGTCIIASSGMLHNESASAKYAEYFVEDPLSTIAFTGYLDSKSTGYKLLEQRHHPTRYIEINGYIKEVKASIESYRLSAHVSREDLLTMILKFQPKHVLLMHGEHEKRYQPIHSTASGQELYPSIVELLNWTDLNVICAKNGEKYEF